MKFAATAVNFMKFIENKLISFDFSCAGGNVTCSYKLG